LESYVYYPDDPSLPPEETIYQQIAVHVYAPDGTFPFRGGNKVIFSREAAPGRVLALDMVIDNSDYYFSYALVNANNQSAGVVRKVALNNIYTGWTVALGLNYSANTLKVAGDGVYLGGAFGGGNFIAKYTNAGQKVWSNTFSTPTATGSESIEGLATAAQINAVFPAGYGYAGSADGFVTRTNAATGDAGWLRQ
jgi:outer membrane protein assembly factor BamB